MCVGRTERLHRRNYIGKDFFAKGERTRAANTCSASGLPRAQRRFPSPSPCPKEERAGRAGRFSAVSLLSSSLPARSSRGEREKRPQRFSWRTLLASRVRSRSTASLRPVAAGSLFTGQTLGTIEGRGNE